MQLSEMQICAFVQQVFQKGTQCVELQGRQGSLGYNRFQSDLRCSRTTMEGGTASSKQICRVLYILSGRPRKNSVSSWLRKLSKHFGVTVEVEMVDIQIKPHLDITKDSVQQQLLSKIAAGRYLAVLLSPPCSTFTRVTWANRRGPRPVRSFVKFRGFARLSWSERKRANWGNILTDFSFEAFAKQMVHADAMALYDNPEDLGAIRAGENRGIRPGSMWQFEKFSELLLLDNVDTAAFYQADFGTDYLKPTRLLLGGFSVLPEQLVAGQPCFDDQGFYVGPLAKRSAKRQLVGNVGSHFATTGSEQWPSKMCKWIATAILEKFSALQTSAVLADDGDLGTISDRQEQYKVFTAGRQEAGRRSGGSPQMSTSRQGIDVSMTVLGCFQWDVGMLKTGFGSMGAFWKQLRQGTIALIEAHLVDPRELDRACFEMAVKGEEGCNIVRG